MIEERAQQFNLSKILKKIGLVGMYNLHWR